MKRRWITIIVFLVVSILVYGIFCAIIAHVGGNPLPMDTWARDLAYNTRGEKGGFIYWLYRILTELGNTYFIIVLVIAGLFYTKLDRRWLCFGLCVLLEVCLNAVFKNIFQRERPYLEFQWMHESSTSFPSGHSTSSGATYAFLLYVFLLSDHKKIIKYLLVAASAVLMIIIPISRIILGMHYLSDCIAGVMLGFICAGLLMVICELFRTYDILNVGVIQLKKKS